MSDYVSLRKAIEFELLGGYTLTPKFFENTSEEQTGLNEFIKVFIIAPGSEMESITGDDTINTGAIMIQIFTPKNIGPNRSDVIANDLRARLINKEADSGKLFTAGVRKLQGPENNYYHQVNLEVLFTFSFQN